MGVRSIVGKRSAHFDEDQVRPWVVSVGKVCKGITTVGEAGDCTVEPSEYLGCEADSRITILVLVRPRAKQVDSGQSGWLTYYRQLDRVWYMLRLHYMAFWTTAVM